MLPVNVYPFGHEYPLKIGSYLYGQWEGVVDGVRVPVPV